MASCRTLHCVNNNFMYYTRGNVTSAGPIKNAHHTHERERMLAKRKFLDFVQSYKRAQYNQQPTQVPTNADLMEFSDYVRMLDTRTSPRPAHSPEHQLHKQRATSNYSHNRKKSKIIDSCQPYFIVTIPKTAP
jgi:hypothetical protein